MIGIIDQPYAMGSSSRNIVYPESQADHSLLSEVSDVGLLDD